MKATRLVRAVAGVAASALTVAGLAAVAIAPASAAARSTVILHSSGEITSLNSSTSTGNTTYNGIVGYLTGAGFTYYDNQTNLIRNTNFGSFAISKKTATDFRITYKVKAGQKWSDGTPIDAVDLLLSHVISSSGYSKAAGLGDPSSTTPAFDSVGYSGPYDDNIVGLPTLSDNNMTLTLRFKKILPDWELLAPGPSPVHALELMADGKKTLGTAAESKAAKAQFLKDFTSKNTARLKKMGNIWTNNYNIQTVNSSTNPLLLVSNGGYIVKAATPSSMTLVRNANYTSGPKMATTNPIKTILIKVINNPVDAAAALRNGDIDIYYDTNPTAASKATLDSIRSVTVLANTGSSYSHFDLRVATANGKTGTYTGPFAGDSAQAKDLRHAFLLALPREQMVETLIKPVNPKATPMDTQFAFPGTSSYAAITKGSGVAEYSEGTQADRTAKALALVKKYYSTASATVQPVKVKLLFASTSSLRVSLAKLIKAEAAKAGFDVDTTGNADIFGTAEPTKSNDYDASMYGFSLTSITQGTSAEVYKTDGGNNNWGWSNSTLDGILKSLQSDALTSAQVLAKRAAADKIIHDNYWGLPLYQSATLTAYTKSLYNVKQSPLSPNHVWNYWEWHY